ncbi:phosphate ABC transporter ATP-binding protein [Sorangium sp. So ce260]|uniref:phosphate ABC transporter ATP-binding protein n=1 Tax=Sorangium sp. So ce260 TaxID=3133291 RepID=UPI003F5F7217
MTAPETPAAARRDASTGPKIELRDLSVGFGGPCVVRGVNVAVPANTIYAFIGPSGSGKTTILRTINLLSIEVDGAWVQGEILLDGTDVLGRGVSPGAIRRRIGMVFATPQPLPRSIYENLVFGPRLAGIRRRAELDEIVETSLGAAQLWDEVKDRLHGSALALSGGQQQRLCIARTLALGPEVVLLDEPCSGLDPVSTLKIEQAMELLRSRITWIVVTNNTKQAARLSDRTAFFLLGELVEDGPTARIFTAPADRRTADYIEGRFG